MMMTHRQRMLMAVSGQMPDILPYAPRIDLWYRANAQAGTLPLHHQGRTADEISRAEGWALHKVVPDYVGHPDAPLHRGIGAYCLREHVFRFTFSPKIDIRIKRDNERTVVEYHTPIGTATTTIIYTQEMRKSGVSIPWIEEHIIKKREDYRIVAHLFENIELVPYFDEFFAWQKEVGEDGVAATYFAGAASPMHHIQKYFLDATEFYFHYSDYQREMRALVESMAPLYEKALRIIADSPAEMVNWGGNFDDTITYPPYFEKEIVPWIRKAAEVLGEQGKLVLCHCDGENQGLLDLIRDSGMHVAEAICPYPMTKVGIGEYYQRWGDKLTIFGGIPSNILLSESSTDEEFDSYLDHLFKAIVPGRRFILGVADTTPPGGVFERLVRTGERVEKKGRLPLEGGAARPLSESVLDDAKTRVAPRAIRDETFKLIQENVLKGRDDVIVEHVQEMLRMGTSPDDIVQKGMIAAMEIIGEDFQNGSAFIPEVLLSARAMNTALDFLRPYLAGGTGEASGKVIIGTVRGDMHDIGKNMVTAMLRGIGFEVVDLGINVPTKEFVKQVADHQPDILGMSALLTTTMWEMRNVIQALKEAGLREKVRIIVGGAPVNQRLAEEIGADGYGHDAGEAVALAKGLMRAR
jgi:corrinoid protein of di/trimethylamine methyltransferase